MLLWKDICSNRLLANVDLVLFLNKCDILEKKLRSGIRLQKYIKSYGDRPNDLNSASTCALAFWSLSFFLTGFFLSFRLDLRSKFSAIHREYSPNPRKFYAFCTSVTVSILFLASHLLADKSTGLYDDSRDPHQRFVFFVFMFCPLSRSLLICLCSKRHGRSTESETVEASVTCTPCSHLFLI